MVSTRGSGRDDCPLYMLEDAFSRLCSGRSRAEGEGPGGWGGAEGEEPCNMEARGGAEEEGLDMCLAEGIKRRFMRGIWKVGTIWKGGMIWRESSFWCCCVVDWSCSNS